MLQHASLTRRVRSFSSSDLVFLQDALDLIICLPLPLADGPSRPHLISQLVRAHVICLVYSISEPSSFERVAEYWLPLFRREGVNVSDWLLLCAGWTHVD
jgi:hypothetical protein